MSLLTTGYDVSNSTASSSEASRFRIVVKNYLRSPFSQRPELFEQVSKYIRFSPNYDELINEFVLICTGTEEVPDCIEAAVDVLRQFPAICEYTWQFLIRDVQNYNSTYSERAYKPNDDYWHVLLKSVAGAEVEVSRRIQIIGACRFAASRSMKEIVIESLDEVDDETARELIAEFTSDEDQFIADLANEILEN